MDDEYKCYREEAVEVAFEDFMDIVDWYARGTGDTDRENCAKILLSEFAQRLLDEEVDDGYVD